MKVCECDNKGFFVKKPEGKAEVIKCKRCNKPQAYAFVERYKLQDKQTPGGLLK